MYNWAVLLGSWPTRSSRLFFPPDRSSRSVSLPSTDAPSSAGRAKRGRRSPKTAGAVTRRKAGERGELLNLFPGEMHRAKKAKVESTTYAVSPYRFSHLPPEIKVTILSKVNVVEAIRASILSSAWRNLWTTSPKILLCDMYHTFDPPETTARSKFITLVDLALLLHTASLDSFILACFRTYHDVFDRWMYMLSRKKPKSIRIKFYEGHNYKIPSSLFSISDLEYLHLKKCIISLPQKFEGFKRLTVLNLKYFSSTDKIKGNFQDFLLHAPNLCTVYVTPDKTEIQQSVVNAGNRKNFLNFVSLTSIQRLDVKRCIVALPREFEGFKRCLRIHAQALKNLEVEGNFEDFHLHAPYLSHLYLTFDKTEPQQSVAAVGDKKNYLKQAFGNQTNIEEITISGSFLTYLSKGCLLIEPPGVFGFLRKICIVKCLWNWTEVLGACSIFQNAPNFRELEIWGKTIWDQDQTKIEEPNMHYLVTVTIKGFAGLEYEVDLVGLLLRWSPSLEELKIFRVKDHNDDDDDEDEDEDDEDNECICKVLTKLLALLRASNKAKITAKLEPTSALTLDKFSRLPQEIKATILSKLNSLDAIRTSILSSAWRNVWTTLREIHLADQYLSWGSSETTMRSNFITLVDLALLFHNGPLVSFTIIGAKRYHDVFDRWMYMLSRKKPRSITIKFYSGHYYKNLSSLFSINGLEYLHLKRCIIGMPQDFEGFKLLTDLSLKYFSSTDSDINNLISSCPLLNTLCLKYFEGISCLSIQAQALQYLEVKGNFEDLHLHAPNLSNVYVTLDKIEAKQSVVVSGNRKNYLKQAFVSLTTVQRLVIKRCFIALPREFVSFKHLLVLNLKYFSSTDNDLNNLISSCPWLNTLRLIYFEGINCLRIQSEKLEVLEVEGIFGDLHLHAPNMTHVYLTLDETDPQQSVAVVEDRKNYLKQAFASQTSIKVLTISGSFLKYLSKGCLLKKLPGVFDCLKKICIEKCFWNWREVLGACLIFQNAPNFRELEIWSFLCPEDFRRKKMWDQDQMKIEEPTLQHLVTVTIKGFAGLEYEVALGRCLVQIYTADGAYVICDQNFTSNLEIRG
uniref:F-box domain-containing protein n=1 Tax=Leersia perrieri TaxID=77586 RepID=A0A0D9VGR0_9ORYZ